MDYMKDGKRRSEFWPRQDLANDPAGQEQAGRIARGAILRIALGKMTSDKDLVQGLMRVWNGEKPEDVRANDLIGFFWNSPAGTPGGLQVMKPTVFPKTVSQKEKELVLELRKLVVGS